MNEDVDAQSLSYQFSEPEKTADKAMPLIVAEYTALRDETLKRIEFRYQLIALTLIVAGTFLTVGLQPGVPASILLVYPILTLLLTAVWVHNRVVLMKIAAYIREHLEAKVIGLGWESFLKDSRPPFFGLLGTLSTGGIFLTTQLIALLLALLRSTFTVIEIVLLIGDFIAIALTLALLRYISQIRR